MTALIASPALNYLHRDCLYLVMSYVEHEPVKVYLHYLFDTPITTKNRDRVIYQLRLAAASGALHKGETVMDDLMLTWADKASDPVPSSEPPDPDDLRRVRGILAKKFERFSCWTCLQRPRLLSHFVNGNPGDRLVHPDHALRQCLTCYQADLRPHIMSLRQTVKILGRCPRTNPPRLLWSEGSVYLASDVQATASAEKLRKRRSRVLKIRKAVKAWRDTTSQSETRHNDTSASVSKKRQRKQPPISVQEELRLLETSALPVFGMLRVLYRQAYLHDGLLTRRYVRRRLKEWQLQPEVLQDLCQTRDQGHHTALSQSTPFLSAVDAERFKVADAFSIVHWGQNKTRKVDRSGQSKDHLQ